MGNVDSARRLIESLRAAGVQEYCVCAGSRNSPLLAVLGGSRERLFSFVDERSAAFFAVGRVKRSGRPVAVVTTSGTAAAELLPATVEAYYSGLPLVLVTADRPARYRGTGAPQSIEQHGILGVYAETSLEGWRGAKPLHLNVEFDEPLIDGEVGSPGDAGEPAGVDLVTGTAGEVRRATAGDVLGRFERPLVILGGLSRPDREKVKRFARTLNAPVYAEALSGLREDRDLPLITAGERMIGRGSFDGVIRIGTVPTLRFWRDLEDLPLPVVHFSRLPFTGLTRGVMHSIDDLPDTPAARPTDAAFFAQDGELAAAFGRILDGEPLSELAMIRTLSRELRPGTRLYVGNSLPVREWDLVASRDLREVDVEANRGANGIDGQLSTFFGQCDPAAENVCLVGDLTAICDLGAPWILPQLGGLRFRIVVVNNGGGRIFCRVPSLRAIDPEVRSRIIENVHSLRFDGWASMWGIGPQLQELRPDEGASARVWQRYEELWR